MNDIYDYIEAGYHIFPLHTIINGKCDCGENCDSVGKHPVATSWQHTPAWSDEQLDNLVKHMIKTGYGVLVGQHLVVDVDPRNGGKASYDKLCKDLGFDLIEKSGFTVTTGGAGWHIYFLRTEGSFAQTLKEYPGIDFKTTGFVVGCGSLHASGMRYERLKGYPQDTNEAPSELLDLIKRKHFTRAIINGFDVDVTMADLKEMLGYYKNTDLHYDDWITVGMALHHSTQGSAEGYSLWEDWSAVSKKHNSAKMDKKWQSFGKYHNPITLGTLIHFAEQNGYVKPVTFEAKEPIITQKDSSALPFDVSHCDPLMPPGLTGKIAQWIDQQGFYPRQRLACMAAIMAISNSAGLFWQEDLTKVTLNMMALCVAGSGTGKESVQESFFEILRQADLAACVHGDIKSKQEIIRNLIEHQAAMYLTDEIGEILKTIENAKKRGGAVYLEGITGDILKIFTKAHSVLPVAGDVRRDTLDGLKRKINQITTALEKEPSPIKAARLEASLQAAINLHDVIKTGGGLPRPFLSLFGFTTLDSLEPALSVEMAKNGFLNRAFIIEERETNPKPNPRFAPSEFPYTNEIKSIATAGSYDMQKSGRVEYLGAARRIKTEPPAITLLNELMDWQWRFAEYHKVTTGYEALARRAYEFISKVSATLAVADGGIRTIEHVKWATAFVKWDIDEKIRLIKYVDAENSTSVDTVSQGLQSRILSICQEPQYLSVINQRLCKRKGVTKENIENLVAQMVNSGILVMQGKKYVVSQ